MTNKIDSLRQEGRRKVLSDGADRDPRYIGSVGSVMIYDHGSVAFLRSKRAYFRCSIPKSIPESRQFLSILDVIANVFRSPWSSGEDLTDWADACTFVSASTMNSIYDVRQAVVLLFDNGMFPNASFLPNREEEYFRYREYTLTAEEYIQEAPPVTTILPPVTAEAYVPETDNMYAIPSGECPF